MLRTNDEVFAVILKTLSQASKKGAGGGGGRSCRSDASGVRAESVVSCGITFARTAVGASMGKNVPISVRTCGITDSKKAVDLPQTMLPTRESKSRMEARRSFGHTHWCGKRIKAC